MANASREGSAIRQSAIAWPAGRWDSSGLKYCAAPQSKTEISFLVMPSASPSALPKEAARADIVEGHDRLVPWPGARQRDFQLGDDAVGAVGVDGLHDLFAA